ncbi:MAG: N-acetylmuramoyl-L-alanine amidase [Opitutaceae bacterium]|nr:N-acetylmuramoyl-L-alanine amidase [Opitutaceae bacterium]
MIFTALTGCQTKPTAPAPATATVESEPVVRAAASASEQPQPQSGHAIIVAGQRFDADTRVVTWAEPGGYNAYRVPPPAPGKPVELYENHGIRKLPDPAGGAPIEPVSPPDLATLREVVDQFVLHYDGKGSSKQTFAILQKRGLSAHFLLDVDGTIYQTLDLCERAYHATIANSRSIGIEIANLGAYPPGETKEFDAWYQSEPSGEIVMRSPQASDATGIRTPDFVARPARPGLVRGVIHGQELDQYDFTPEQYAALGKLVAALHRVFPKIALDYPRDTDGRPLMRVLSPEEFPKFRGLIAHFHIQANKIDPGPAFQWDLVLGTAREEIESGKVTY